MPTVWTAWKVSSPPAFAAFWWSHVPKERLQSFLTDFHQKLSPGALVCFIDNRYVEGSSTAISSTDTRGNTYQQRVLKDGATFRVLKNFPSREELESSVAAWSSAIDIVELEYYWFMSYRLNLFEDNRKSSEISG